MRLRTPVPVAVLWLALLAAAAAACAQTAENRADNVARSWDAATVLVPGQLFATSPHRVTVDKPLPVVIFMHGCTGITGNHDLRWGHYLKGLGFITVLPDSMARPGRRSNCDPRAKRLGFFPQAHAMRQEEIRYAVEQIRKSSWADAGNVFLMGHSEGGSAAARNRLGGFRGVIISAWSCTHARNPGFDGIFAPPDTPVLTLEWSHDPWRVGTPAEGSCANRFGKRKNARQVLFSGGEHDTYHQSEAREAVAQFLKEHLARREAGALEAARGRREASGE
jgi:dienelactone hydrolase